MNIEIIENNADILSGITLKDSNLFESGNLGLHATKNPNKIMENRKAFATTIDVPLSHLTTAHQTHSDHLYKVTLEDKGRGATSMITAIPDTDALYTTEPHILLGTLTADCVPVLFYDLNKHIIGVIHSGWQGTVKEITRKVFTHLIKKENSRPEDIHIFLGPALSQKKFEVDADVYHKYIKLDYTRDYMYFNTSTNKYHINNQGVVMKQCELSGIPATNIISDKTCTFLSENHFSYRQDHQTGRHLSFIMRKE